MLFSQKYNQNVVAENDAAQNQETVVHCSGNNGGAPPSKHDDGTNQNSCQYKTKRSRHGGRPIIVAGVEYASLRNAVSHYGLNYATVSDRLRSKYWTIEEAFGLTPHKPVVTHTGLAKSICINGRHFASIDDACCTYGINRSLVYTRRKRGWTTEEAFGIVPRGTLKYGDSCRGCGNAKSVTIQGMRFASIKSAAAYFNVHYQTLYWRLKKGMSIEEALTR